MAKLVLDENYSVEMDSYNFTLKYKKSVYDELKKKDVATSNEWHFPTFQSALGKYLNECIRPLESIQALNAELQRIEKLITTIKT